jgi:hypothetical protein
MFVSMADASDEGSLRFGACRFCGRLWDSSQLRFGVPAKSSNGPEVCDDRNHRWREFAGHATDTHRRDVAFGEVAILLWITDL